MPPREYVDKRKNQYRNADLDNHSKGINHNFPAESGARPRSVVCPTLQNRRSDCRLAVKYVVFFIQQAPVNKQ